MENRSSVVQKSLALAAFSQKLAAMLEMGIPIVQSLEVAENEAAPPYDAAARRIKESVLSGAMPSEAMKHMPELFSEFYVKSIIAGEIGGILEIMLDDLGELLDEYWQIQRAGEKAGAWEWAFFSSGDRAPLDWSELDAQQKKMVLVLFCKSFGSMLTAGVPKKPALETAACLLPESQREAVTSMVSEENWDGSLRNREELAFLPKFASVMIAIGEIAGSLDLTMQKAASVYRRELQRESA